MDDTADGLIVTASMACSANLAVGFRFPSTNVSATYRGASPQLFNIGLGALLVPSTNASDLNCTISIVGQDVPDLPGLWVLGQSKSDCLANREKMSGLLLLTVSCPLFQHSSKAITSTTILPTRPLALLL